MFCQWLVTHYVSRTHTKRRKHTARSKVCAINYFYVTRKHAFRDFAKPLQFRPSDSSSSCTVSKRLDIIKLFSAPGRPIMSIIVAFSCETQRRNSTGWRQPNSRISTDTINNTRYGHSYHGTLTESHIWSIKSCHYRSPWYEWLFQLR